MHPAGPDTRPFFPRADTVPVKAAHLFFWDPWELAGCGLVAVLALSIESLPEQQGWAKSPERYDCSSLDMEFLLSIGLQDMPAMVLGLDLSCEPMHPWRSLLQTPCNAETVVRMECLFALMGCCVGRFGTERVNFEYRDASKHNRALSQEGHTT